MYHNHCVFCVVVVWVEWGLLMGQLNRVMEHDNELPFYLPATGRDALLMGGGETPYHPGYWLNGNDMAVRPMC